jgi:transposase
MSEWVSKLAERLIVGHKRDGRCVYDEQAKQELILACGRAGISMAKLARDCGINANLLNTWVRKHERKALAASAAVDAESVSPVFVPVHIEAAQPQGQASLQMQVRLPNGVVVDLGGCELPQACELIEALGRMRCSASSRT